MTPSAPHAPSAQTREILIAGLGSIGRRHLRNLRALGWPCIRLYRTGRATLPEAELDGYPVEIDLETALARAPLAVVVANPTALHVPVALAAARAGAHLLLEKPVSDSRDGVADLQTVVHEQRLAVLMGFHFRYSPGLRQIARWIQDGDLGTVVAAEAHWSECLPDMHPWEDFRTSYAARADLGGGVLNTLCHPFDYLRWLLGEVATVSALESGRGAFGLSVDTAVDVSLTFVSGATARIHLDFIERPRRHRLLITGTKATAGWSDHDHRAWLGRPGATLPMSVAAPPDFERNTLYLEEMAHFLACVRGAAEPCCTLRDGEAALEIVLGAKQAIAQDSARDLAVAQ